MKFRTVVIASLLATLSVPVVAQDNTQAALNRAQGMLRQLSSQKMALEAQVAQLQKELESAQSDLELQKKKSEKREDKFKGAIGEWKAEYTALKEKFYQTTDALRQTLSERDDLNNKLQATTANFETCYQSNHKLVSMNEELLSAYRNKGVWAALSEREPVTGLGKVEAENLLQTYRHDIEDQDLSMNQYKLHQLDGEQQ